MVCTKSPPELLCSVEALWLRDREHTEEPLPTPEVVVPDGRVVLLSGRVQDVYLDLLSVQHHLEYTVLAFRTWNNTFIRTNIPATLFFTYTGCLED